VSQCIRDFMISGCDKFKSRAANHAYTYVRAHATRQIPLLLLAAGACQHDDVVLEYERAYFWNEKHVRVDAR
jgi:hypothetical protein